MTPAQAEVKAMVLLIPLVAVAVGVHAAVVAAEVAVKAAEAAMKAVVTWCPAAK